MPDPDSPITKARTAAVAATMEDIRALERDLGVTREGVAAIRDRLMALAEYRELFPLTDFPVPCDNPDDPSDARSALHRLSQDEDNRFALYAQVSNGGIKTPPHNHTTWAVVVGFEGQELNRFYRRTGKRSVVEIHQHVVQAGSGVAMLPDDVHSIHIEGPALNFHCYGMALEELHLREYFDDELRRWKLFTATSDIKEARPEFMRPATC